MERKIGGGAGCGRRAGVGISTRRPRTNTRAYPAGRASTRPGWCNRLQQTPGCKGRRWGPATFERTFRKTNCTRRAGGREGFGVAPEREGGRALLDAWAGTRVGAGPGSLAATHARMRVPRPSPRSPGESVSSAVCHVVRSPAPGRERGVQKPHKLVHVALLPVPPCSHAKRDAAACSKDGERLAAERAT